MKKEQGVTSLRVNPETWKEVKIEAIRQNMAFSKAVDEALRQWLKDKRETKSL